jgi:3-oxoadipate enol-lactonase
VLVDVGRGQLAVDVVGPDDAPPVLLIAGGGGSRRSWARVVDELVADRRIAVFDQAGVDESVDVPMCMTALEYAADALAVGRAALGERFHVVGMSLGGIAAQHLALDHPEMVLTLTLVSTVPGLSRFAMGDGDQRHEDERSFSARFVAEETERWRAIVDEGKRTRHSPDSSNSQIQIFVSHDACERLPSLTVPTTVVCGTDDTTFPFANSETLADLIPGADLVAIEGAGHAVHQETAPLLAHVIRERTAR